MDLQKEREAFEAYMAEKYKNLMDRRQCRNNGGGYMSWDMNVAWQVWQAAKAHEAKKIEGCVMDIQDTKEQRQAFDEWHYEQYLLENPNIDISNAKYIYDYAHKNVLVFQLKESHFTAWQAAIARMEVRINTLDETLLNQGEALAQAKAQAVPDGFVVVPKEPTDAMLFAASGRDIVAEHYGDENIMWPELRETWKAMLEAAQEPAND